MTKFHYPVVTPVVLGAASINAVLMILTASTSAVSKFALFLTLLSVAIQAAREFAHD